MNTAVSARNAVRRTENLALTLACLGSFVVILDATIVSVALPELRADLGLSAGALSWVVNAYTLAFAGFLLLGGRCGDAFGARRIFLLGMAMFTVARVLAGASTDQGVLLTVRAVQGLGGALLMPVTLAILTTTFIEPARRARALGLWSAVGAIGAASGPVLGGLLTEWLSWRWVFFVTTPIGIAAMALAARILPRERPGRAVRVDVAGAVLATSGLVAVVYGVMESAGPKDISVFGPLAVGGALLTLFLIHQARWTSDPLLPLRIFRSRAVSSGNGVMLLLGLGFFASPILLSLYLQDVMGYGPMRAGLGYLPLGVAMFIGARAAGPCTVRWGPRRAAIACCLIGAAGFLGVAALLGPDRPYLLAVGLPGLILGLGSAGAFTPITVAATSGVAAAEQGTAAGLLNTTRQFSGALGLAALTTVAATVTRHTGGPHDPAAVSHGYSAAFAIAGVCLIIAATAAALVMPRDS